MPVRLRFAFATAMASAWLGLSIYLAVPWADDLALAIGPLAWLVIGSVALVPGFLNMHIFASILMDRPHRLPRLPELPPVTVLIAAYNEGRGLRATLIGLSSQSYPGAWEVLVIDDGSTDDTRSALEDLSPRLPRLRYRTIAHQGKAQALNEGLREIDTPIVVTIDADTRLHRESLERIVVRLITDPPHTAAVAGAVLVRNSRANLLTRLQEWDYFLSIASVKRQQSLYQGTLVAQGAFSAYKTAALREVGGWPDRVGEDIVLTWALLKLGYRIGFEASAAAFTTVPTALTNFGRQRERWARGMIEGLKMHGDILWRRPRLSAFFIFIDALFPLIDVAYVCAFLPGVVLAFFGHYWIAGPVTLFVIPLSALITLAMFRCQKPVFDELGLRVRRNGVGYVLFLLFYQALLSPYAVLGYVKELSGVPRRW